MNIHDYGPKKNKDRQFLMSMYQSMIKAWRLKPVTPEVLSKMSNSQFQRMLEDIYNAQPEKELEWHRQLTGTNKRNGFKWRWFLFDLFDAKKHPIKNLDQKRLYKVPLVMKEAENA